MSDRFPFPIPDGWSGVADREWAARVDSPPARG